MKRNRSNPTYYYDYTFINIGGGNNDIRERIRNRGIKPYMWILCCKLLPALLSSQGTVNVSGSSNDILKKNPVTAYEGHNRILYYIGFLPLLLLSVVSGVARAWL